MKFSLRDFLKTSAACGIAAAERQAYYFNDQQNPRVPENNQLKNIV